MNRYLLVWLADGADDVLAATVDAESESAARQCWIDGMFDTGPFEPPDYEPWLTLRGAAMVHTSVVVTDLGQVKE